MRAARCIAIVASVLVLAAAPARADEPSSLLDRLYLEETGFAVWTRGPTLEGTGTALFDDATDLRTSRQLADDARVQTWGGGWDGRLGVGVAERWAVELGGSYLRADEALHDSVDTTDGELLVPLINGLGALGYIAFSGERFRQDIDARLDLFDTRLGVARDVTIYAEGFSGKARLGVVGGRLEQDYRIDHTAATITDATGSQRLDEELDSWFLGPYLGLSVVGKLTERLRMTMDTDIALLHTHSELDASQRLVGPAVDAMGLLCGLTGVPPCRIDEQDEEDHFSARPRIRLGLDFDFGPFALGVTGGVTYWSYAPQVVNPTIDASTTTFPNIPGFGAAHVGGDDLFLADVGVHLTVPLGARGEEALPSLIDNLYLEQTGHAVWLSAPRVRGLGATIFDFDAPSGTGTTAANQIDDDGRVEGIGGGWDGRLGIAVARGWDAELGGSFFRADDASSTSVELADDAQFAAFPLIDGTGTLALIDAGNGGESIEQEFEGQIDLFDARLGVAREVAIGGALRGKLRLGVVGGRLEQDYRIDHRPARLFDDTAFNDLDEELNSWFVGPYLGLSLAGDLTRWLRITLETDLGLLYNEAELDASQHFAGVTFPLSCGLLGLPTCDIDERDRESHFSARPRARLSIDFDLGPVILGVTGGFTWWTYAPQVVNPELDGFANTDPPALPGTAKAHIGGEDLIMADVGLRLIIPFGRP